MDETNDTPADITSVSLDQLQATLASREQDRLKEAADAPLPTRDRPLADMSIEELQKASLGHQLRQEQILAPARQFVGQNMPAEEPTSTYLGRNIGRTAFNAITGYQYGQAKERLSAEQHTDADLQTIAEYEHLQGWKAKAADTTGGAVAEAGLALPGQAAEFLTGGVVLKGLGAGMRALGLLGSAAEAAAPAGLLARMGTGAARAAATTPAVPSLYLERWQQNNIDAGRSPQDLAGLPNALALGGIQNAVLGLFGGATETAFAGKGIAGAAGRVGIQAAGGPFAQAAADIAASAAGLDVGYGVAGDLAKGKWGDAAKHTVVTAMTFAAFGGQHEFMKGVAGELRTQQRRGISVAAAAEQIQPTVDVAVRAAALSETPRAMAPDVSPPSYPERQTEGLRRTSPAADVRLQDGRLVDVARPLTFQEAQAVRRKGGFKAGQPIDDARLLQAIAEALPDRVQSRDRAIEPDRGSIPEPNVDATVNPQSGIPEPNLEAMTRELPGQVELPDRAPEPNRPPVEEIGPPTAEQGVAAAFEPRPQFAQDRSGAALPGAGQSTVGGPDRPAAVKRQLATPENAGPGQDRAPGGPSLDVRGAIGKKFGHAPREWTPGVLEGKLAAEAGVAAIARHIKKNPGVDGVLVGIDVGNQKGLNAAYGGVNSEADAKALGPLTVMIREELAKAAPGARVDLVKNGGDEFTALVHGPAIDRAKVAGAMERVHLRFRDHLARQGFDPVNAENPRAPKPRYAPADTPADRAAHGQALAEYEQSKGFGVRVGIADIHPGSTFESLDKQVGVQHTIAKHEGKVHVHGEHAQEDRPVAPAAEAGRVEGRAAEAPGRNGEGQPKPVGPAAAAAPAPEVVPSPAVQPVGNRPPAALELGRRLLAGEDVSLQDLVKIGGLDRKEAHVIRERFLNKRALAEIGNDKVALLGLKSKERVRQYEAGGRAKLGIERSAEDLAVGPEKDARAAELRARAQGSEVPEAAAAQPRAAKTPLEIQTDRIARLTGRMVAETEAAGGKLPKARRKYYQQEAEKIVAETTRASARAAAKRSPAGEPPAAVGPTPEEAAQAARDQIDAAKFKALPFAEQMKRRKVEAAYPKVFEDAKAAGASMADLHAYAQSLLRPGREYDAELAKLVKDAKDTLSKVYNVSPQKLAAIVKKGGDYADVPGFDAVVRSMAGRHPGFFKGYNGFESEASAADDARVNSSQILWDYLRGYNAEGGLKRPRMTEEQAYEHSLAEFLNAKESSLVAEAARAGASPEAIEEARGVGKGPAVDAGEGQGQADESGHSGDAGDFDPSSFAMGAAGTGGDVEPAPPAGTKGAKSTIVGDRTPTASPSSSWFQKVADFLKSFGQQQFPALTRLSPAAGEKLAQTANAKNAAKASFDYFSRILKVGDSTLADLSPEDRRAVGAVWLERRMRKYREWLRAMGRDASKVGTFVGQEGSPLKTEADYAAGRDALWSFWEAIRQEWTPEVEKNFRGLLGLDPGDEIDSRSQIPGLPLNAIAVDEADPARGIVGTGRKRGMENLRIGKPGFTKSAELSAGAYDLDIMHMMQRTLNLGIPAARRAEFVRTAIADGVIKAVEGKDRAPDGWRYLGLDPARGLPGLDPKAKYYVHPDAYRDVVQGLSLNEHPAHAFASGLAPFTGLLNKFALMSPVELATHVANHVTAMFRAGMGVPIWNLKDSFANAYRLWQKEPEILRRVMELAKMGASFGHDASPGILGEKADTFLKRFTLGVGDPTARVNEFTSKLIDVMQKGVRVQLEDAYDKMRARGLFPDSETAKRNYINAALGNYNAEATNRVTQFLKDTGLQPFGTAAHTFTVQGGKSATGGAINAPATSPAAAAQLRATALLKFLPFLAMGPVINALRWGKPFPAGVPSFAVQTRDDGDGKKHFFDPLAFTGIRRGWRATFQNAFIERAIQGEAGGSLADHAIADAWHTAEHLAAGPTVQFAHTALTGENALGRQVATKVSTAKTSAGVHAAEKKGLPEPGSSQYWENVKAAAAGVNPIVASLQDAAKAKKPRTWLETVMQSAGPFGEKTRDAAKQKR